MDEGHNKGGDGPEYVFLGDSGVIHVEKPSKWNEKPAKKVSREAREEAERILRESDVMRVRMELRNSLRKWYEKSPWLADLLHVPYLPKMSAQEIYDEHNAILEKKIAKAAGSADGGDYPAEALLLLAEDGNPDKDLCTLRAEEYAKQVAHKFIWHVKHSGYEVATDYAKWTLAGIEDEFRKEAVLELIRLKGGEIISDLIREKKSDEAVKAFFELGAVCEFRREDLFEVTDAEMRDPAVKEAFLKGLAGTVGEDASLEIFAKVRDHMEDVGFFTQREVGASGEVKDAVRRWLESAVEKHAVVYREVLEAVEQAGLNRGIDKDKMRCRTLLVSRLILMMRKSPELFAVIRDRWVSWYVLEHRDVEEDRALEVVFNGHLKRCFERHPFFYNKMKHHWRSLGLHETREEEIGRRISANWSAKIEFGDDGFDDGVIADFEKEKEEAAMLITTEGAGESLHLTDFLLRCSEKLEEFERKYPQYSDKK